MGKDAYDPTDIPASAAPVPAAPAPDNVIPMTPATTPTTPTEVPGAPSDASTPEADDVVIPADLQPGVDGMPLDEQQKLDFLQGVLRRQAPGFAFVLGLLERSATMLDEENDLLVAIGDGHPILPDSERAERVMKNAMRIAQIQAAIHILSTDEAEELLVQVEEEMYEEMTEDNDDDEDDADASGEAADESPENTPEGTPEDESSGVPV